MSQVKSQLTFNKFLINNKHLLILKPTLALALIIFGQQVFAKNDLFNNEANTQQVLPSQEMIAAPSEGDDLVEPAISATDAALRAQQHVDGKVMNVRKFRDEEKTLYGVKMLQKNGRMKTVNVDANSGAVIEE